MAIIPAPSPPTEWQARSPTVDTLEYEIQALRVLVNRLAAFQDQPDPDLNDPDTPFKAILSASHRLNTLLRIQNDLHMLALQADALKFHTDLLKYQSQGDSPFTDLLSVLELDKLRLRVGQPGTVSVKELLKLDGNQKYASLFEEYDPETDDLSSFVLSLFGLKGPPGKTDAP
jgi:hypothetical protein